MKRYDVVNSKRFLYQRIGKRIADVVGSSSLLLICIPLILLFSIILFIFSGRPIFFTQTRAGLYNTPFTILKFRTMESTTLESKSHQYEWQGNVPKDFFFEKPKHLNVTKVGEIYRKYSIDEIPQLWNVLNGDMSFVGPRPEIIEITNHYSEEQKKRLQVRPGITGYAQVNGRSTITHGEKIAYDLYYVKNYSFLLDLKIIIQTVKLVITGKGAF
ncbi:sugar transferase [Psychrobacillus sp. FJAT-21963]|uniref:sugar transferase n=1 Tax=Psychrobacillus sp. FJAT-21963 TaxID=1712028 RepID=UPI0006F930D5|nr:sugar transferase [Psychrobacillus sp. FJAT-21963]KQL33379.1 hypothetical protein AN959_17630 [Psychrobacillus sp. FJAT-21963]